MHIDVKTLIDQMPLVERLRIVNMSEAVRLSGMSEDNLRRHYSDRFVRMSPKRVGMRIMDCLMLNASK
jgi:hypothetical protein